MRYLSIFFSFLFLSTYAQRPLPLIARLKHAPETEKIKLYIELSKVYAESQPDSAVHYANEGMRLAEKQNDRQGQASLLLALGHINTLYRHPDLARSFFNEAPGLYPRLHDAAGVAHVYDQLGLLEGNDKDFNTALHYYQDSRDSSGLIETYQDMGEALPTKGEREKALSYYLRALAQYEHRKHRPETYFVYWKALENFISRKATAIQRCVTWKRVSVKARPRAAMPARSIY